MTKIEEVTRYVYNKKEYRTVELAQQAEEDDIAMYINSAIFSSVTLHPGEKIRLMQAILENRSQLSTILSRD